MARARRFLTAAVAAGLVAVTLPGIAAADCEPVLPVADVTTGMNATGWTVATVRGVGYALVPEGERSVA